MTGSSLAAPRPVASRETRRAVGLVAALAGVALLAAAGLAIGARSVPVSVALTALLAPEPGNDLHLIVRDLRLPRSGLAVLAGAALGVAGLLMQAITRNPLAEPGLSGVNAGAALAVLVGVVLFGATRIEDYLWFALGGAALAGLAVFTLGRGHDPLADPARLVLAGAGLSMMLGAMGGALLLNAPADVIDMFRHWGAGSVAGRDPGAVTVLAVGLTLGLGLAFAVTPGLEALALGSDLGRALGARQGPSWGVAGLAVVLLAGSATAAVGPVGFVGLIAPHLARRFAGPGLRWGIAYAAVVGALLLLIADLVGRLIVHPAEIEAGIVAAILGGPVFVWAARHLRWGRR